MASHISPSPHQSPIQDAALSPLGSPPVGLAQASGHVSPVDSPSPFRIVLAQWQDTTWLLLISSRRPVSFSLSREPLALGTSLATLFLVGCFALHSLYHRGSLCPSLVFPRHFFLGFLFTGRCDSFRFCRLWCCCPRWRSKRPDVVGDRQQSSSLGEKHLGTKPNGPMS